MSGFIKRFVLSLVASKLERRAYRRGHGSVVDGLLREVNRRLHRRHGHGYGHRGGYGYHGHYRHHGHYRRRRRW